MKKTLIWIYIVVVTLFSVYLYRENVEKDYIIEEKEYEILECSAVVDSLMTEQEYFLEYLKLEKDETIK